ncbi:MAG TPA: hypothetical protein VD947_03090 [Patescibacteria group bacterium]|nr:hypothetical protein [Patescibacteria group bacterium]
MTQKSLGSAELDRPKLIELENPTDQLATVLWHEFTAEVPDESLHLLTRTYFSLGRLSSSYARQQEEWERQTKDDPDGIYTKEPTKQPEETAVPFIERSQKGVRAYTTLDLDKLYAIVREGKLIKAGGIGRKSAALVTELLNIQVSAINDSNEG